MTASVTRWDQWVRLSTGRLERVALLVAIALLVTIAGFTVYARVMTWTLFDLGVYLDAARDWMTLGNPYYAPEGTAGTVTYRYAPWWAALFIPLTFLPLGVVMVAWSALMVVAALAVPVDIVRRYGQQGIPFAALMISLLVGSAAGGNVQPLAIAALYFGLHTRYGPLVVGLVASLKLTPILFVVPWIGRREWGKVAVAVGVAGLLLAPTLLFELPPDIADSGIASLVDSFPVLWGAVAVGSVLAALTLSRTRYAWLGASAAVVLTIPRSLGLDLSFLSVATSPASTRRSQSDQSPRRPS